MSVSIKITNFEGPFDLLLHLIKKNEMDIHDVKIYEITNQYLEYIKQMKEMDLEITSEFIVIAATLIEIKSKSLLPKNKVENELEDEQDIAKELLHKLIEYKKFKTVAEFLGKRQENTGIMFSKKPEIIEEKNKDVEIDLFKNITMLDLYNIYNEVMYIYLNKMNTETNIQKRISVDTYRIEDKMVELKEKIKKNPKIHFTKLISTYEYKMEIIVTFLALLELIKLKDIRVVQEGNFKDIYLEGVE